MEEDEDSTTCEELMEGWGHVVDLKVGVGIIDNSVMKSENKCNNMK